MKKYSVVLGVLLCCTLVPAGERSEAGVATSPLKIYSGGFGIGALTALNEDLEDVSRQFVKISLMNSIFIKPNLSLFLDLDLLFPGTHGGMDAGFDFIFSDTKFRPFAGVGVGGRYMDHGGETGDDFGPSFTAHAGFNLDLNENVAFRMRIPYHMVMNESRDHAGGLELAFIFSSKWKHVKKLEYN